MATDYGMGKKADSSYSYGSVKVTVTDSRFALLRPVKVSKTALSYTITAKVSDALEFLSSISLVDKRDVVAFDTETNGTHIFGNPKFKIVGISFAHLDKAIYLSFRDKAFAHIQKELRKIKEHIEKLDLPLVAHNLFFDSSVLAYYLGDVRPDRETFDEPAWQRGDLQKYSPFSLTRTGSPGWITTYKYCTYTLFRFLASEGFFEQRWSLKFAQQNLLLWEDTNEAELHGWLLRNGYVTLKNRKRLPKDPPEVVQKKIDAILEGLKEGKKYHPDKGLMYLAPDEILGKYCALDAYSTYHFHMKVLQPAIDKYCTGFFRWFQQEPWMTLLRSCLDNYQRGIYIDRRRLVEYRGQLQVSLGSLRKQIYKVFAEEIDVINKELLKDLVLPAQRYTKARDVGKEPKKYLKASKKGGKKSLSKTWISWYLKKKSVETYGENVVPTYRYAKYLLKKRELKEVLKLKMLPHDFSKTDWRRKFLFNINSTVHKQRILYKGVEYKEHTPYKDEKKPGSILLIEKDLELDYTKSGGLPTGKAAIMALCGPDSPLDKYNKEIKKLQFTESVLNKLTPESLLHLPVKVPGTLTCRLGGDGQLNVQNLVKDIKFLEAWRSDTPKESLILSVDFSSLEPHVLTELSWDSSMLKLYGPDAKPGHDVYAFTAAMCRGPLGQPFVDEGYDTENPDKEKIDALKKKLKKLRNIWKAVVLCVAAGTLIRVKNKGLVPIERVTSTDEVWDGDKWVTTSGAIYSGAKKVVEFEKEFLTEEHNILTTEGWKHVGEISKGDNTSQPIRPKKPGATWSDVWRLGSHIFRSTLSKWVPLYRG